MVDAEKRDGIPDDFDSFVMTTRATPDDVAELASYLYTNSQVRNSASSENLPHVQSIFRRRHASASRQSPKQNSE